MLVAAAGRGRISKPCAAVAVKRQIDVCDRHRAIWSDSETAVEALEAQIEVLNQVLAWLEG